MNRFLACFLLIAVRAGIAADGPVDRPIGLREVVQLANAQNPEVQLARLDVEKSESDLRLIRTERSVRVSAASGLGATSGIPQSIQGATPSVAQVTLRQPLLDFERPRRAHGTRALIESGEHAATATAEKAAHRAGSLYLDFELASREIERLESEVASFERIEGLTVARVEEGSEIPLALARVRLDRARATERLAASVERFDLLEADLRWTLGLGEGVRLKPLPTDTDGSLGVPRSLWPTVHPSSPVHPELAGIDARIRAARHKAREARSARYPSLDIVGQYAMLARFNNYDDYFRRFERHNWQAGVALQVPLFTGRGLAERVARARIEERELEIQQEAKRASIDMQARRAVVAVREAERLGGLAQQELDYARESLDVLMARFDEGLVTLAEVERARVVESTAWGAFVETRYRLAKARLALAYSSGRLGAAFTD
ncbi:MAG: TolC family protein [Bryobacterales bacterium]|nr:TolC family protein [Bryobacterales bacterium]